MTAHQLLLRHFQQQRKLYNLTWARGVSNQLLWGNHKIYFTQTSETNPWLISPLTDPFFEAAGLFLTEGTTLASISLSSSEDSGSATFTSVRGPVSCELPDSCDASRAWSASSLGRDCNRTAFSPYKTRKIWTAIDLTQKWQVVRLYLHVHRNRVFPSKHPRLWQSRACFLDQDSSTISSRHIWEGFERSRSQETTEAEYGQAGCGSWTIQSWNNIW